jgi:hypothetical protein
MDVERFCKPESNYKPAGSVRDEGDFLMFLDGRAINRRGVYTEYENEKRAYARPHKPLVSLGG